MFAKNEKLYIMNVFVALGIQHAKRIRRTILSSAACPDLHYFSTLSHKQNDFREKKVFGHKMYVLLLSKILSQTYLILIRI